MNIMNRETDIRTLQSRAVDIGEKMRFDIVSRHKKAGQYTTGQTSGMLQIEPTVNGFKLVGWKFSGVWEEGRQPNKRPWGTSGSGNTAWSESLINWARVKGLTFATPADAQRWAYCVMRKTAALGSMMYREKRREDIFTTPIENMQNELIETVGVYYSEEIKRTLFRIDIVNNQA